MTVTEVGNYADAYYQMRDEERKVWDERVDRLDLKDKITWEGMCAGMGRAAIGEYLIQYFPSVVNTMYVGNSAVRRLVNHINLEIRREQGEMV